MSISTHLSFGDSQERLAVSPPPEGPATSAYTNSRRRSRLGNGFTLIELLVVVSIISMLIAILLPALRQARHQARKMLASSQMRQQIIGWTSVANDYKGELPEGNRRPTDAGPNTWRDPYGNHDLSRQMKEYGFIKASSHPVIGAPAYDDPAFNGVGRIEGPWAYLPAWQTDWMKPDDPNPNVKPQPRSLQEAGPGNVMMQETLQYHRFTGQRRSLYPMAPPTVVKTNGAPSYYFTNESNPSLGVPNGIDPEGTHVGRYDGSVAFAAFKFHFLGPHDFQVAQIGGNWITPIYADP